MKKYGVYVPIAGRVYKEVEADSEKEAVAKAIRDGFEDEDVEELEMFDKLVEGNVCYTYTTEATAEEIGD